MSFNEIVEQCDNLIWGIVHKYPIKGYDKEDVYQECLTNLYENYDKYDGVNAITTYVQVLCENHIHNLLKMVSTKKRNNYILNSKGNEIILKDVKDFDFNLLSNDEKLSSNEKYIIEVSKQVIDNEKYSTYYYEWLNGDTLQEIADRNNVSKQRIGFITVSITKKIKERLRDEGYTIK